MLTVLSVYVAEVSLLVHTVLGGVFALAGGSIVLGLSLQSLPSLLGLTAAGSGFGFSIVSGLIRPVIMGALQLLFPSYFDFVASPDEAEGNNSPKRSPPQRSRTSSVEKSDFGTQTACFFFVFFLLVHLFDWYLCFVCFIEVVLSIFVRFLLLGLAFFCFVGVVFSVSFMSFLFASRCLICWFVVFVQPRTRCRSVNTVG